MVWQGSLIPMTPEIEGSLFRETVVTAEEALDLLERLRPSSSTR